MSKTKFNRKEWSGGYDNFTRPVNKMNSSEFSIFKNKKFWKRRSMKKQRTHLKKIVIYD